MIELLWTQEAFPAANILHCTFTGGTPTSSDCTSFGEQIASTFWTDPLISDYPTTTALAGVRITDLSTDMGAVGEFAVGSAGTAGDAGAPAQCCVLVNYQIARRYRGGRPRTYYPALANGAVADPGTWDSGVVSDFNEVLTDLYNLLGDASEGSIVLTGQVCVSYVDDKAYRDTNLVEPITGLTVSTRIKTQRRRLTSSSF